MEIRGYIVFSSLYLDFFHIVVIFLECVMIEPSHSTNRFMLKWLSYDVFTVL